jgi:hypothetical protein
MARFEGAFTDSQNWARQLAKEAGNTVSTAIDKAKTAEAAAINSTISNVGGTGLSGAAYVASRGGVNAEGYYNDVPAYQQLTANERKSVTLSNGHIDSAGMLAILKKKEAEYFGRSVDSGVIKAEAPPSVSITATPPAPEPEMFSARMFAAPPPVKTATLDIILFDEESVPTDGMFDQIFENIGGQELISITRSDIVNGQKISYQPIKNLSAIQQRYNPNNILSLQQTADKFFAGFSIKLEDKIPETGNGTNGENVYLNAAGDLIIEFINVNPDEQVETQISVSGTIYEADLGDYAS